LLLFYISRATRRRFFLLKLNQDIFWYNNPERQKACLWIIKQEIDYADLANKDNIYNNLSQEIPEYISLGDNSSLDNNNFEYLPAPKYLSF
jgi:hypothetical protein